MQQQVQFVFVVFAAKCAGGRNGKPKVWRIESIRPFFAMNKDFWLSGLKTACVLGCLSEMHGGRH